MARKTTGANGSHPTGHNYDPGARADIIRKAFDALAEIAAKRDAAVAKFKEQADAQKAKLKGLGFKMADLAPALRIHELKGQAENADSTDDRRKAENRMAMMVATFTECYAAIEETTQLDFNAILEAGEKARSAATEDSNRASFQEDPPRDQQQSH